MKKYSKKTFPHIKSYILIGTIAASFFIILFLSQSKINTSITKISSNKEKPNLVAQGITTKGKNIAAEGKQEYNIMQKGLKGPEFYKLIVNPEKVQPGMAQTMSVWVKDSKSPVKKVTAIIETDNGNVKESLSLVEGTSADGVWNGNWKVKNTTNKKYSTTFIATNGQNEESKARIGWTDPGLPCYVGTADCAPKSVPSGTLTNYSVSWLEGADGGTFTMNDPNVNITVPNNTALNVGQTFIYTAGTLFVQSTSSPAGYLQTGYICCPDADGDGYCTPYCTWSINNGSTCNTGYKRKAGGTGQCQGTGALVNNGYDCYDSGTNAALAYPGSTTCRTAARGDGSFDFNCDGSTSLCYGINGGCNVNCNVTQGFSGNPGCGLQGYYYYSCSEGYTTCTSNRSLVTMSCY